MNKRIAMLTTIILAGGLSGCAALKAEDVKVYCYGDKGFFSFGSESFVCYGKAIKVP